MLVLKFHMRHTRTTDCLNRHDYAYVLGVPHLSSTQIILESRNISRDFEEHIVTLQAEENPKNFDENLFPSSDFFHDPKYVYMPLPSCVVLVLSSFV